jgi:hypothetical protein
MDMDYSNMWDQVFKKCLYSKKYMIRELQKLGYKWDN